MLALPWTSAIEDVLKPYSWAVDAGLVLVVIVTVWILFKGNTTGKTAWLAWLVSP